MRKEPGSVYDSFMCMFCGSLLSFFFWPLFCLFFFDLWILITPLVSSNSSYTSLIDGFWLSPLASCYIYTELTYGGNELRCSGRLSSSCPTSGTRRVNLVTNPVISHQWVKDREVFTTSGTYPWSGHCVVCSSIYGFWLPLWYLQTLPTLHWLMASDYPLWPLVIYIRN
jgi:hypothetical protein